MSPADRAHAVILAGGRGTRFWPLSRRARPKQLLDLTGDGSLLNLTVERLGTLIPPERQWVITSEDLAGAVAAGTPAIDRSRILGEPIGRNTAPAVALAAVLLRDQVGDVPFVVLPSDHLITPLDAFHGALEAALGIVSEREVLLTFGVVPTRPETGYGYIEAGGEIAGAAPTREVVAFTEKPDRETAIGYLDGGRHLWNSGMFAWRSGVVLDGLRRHAPEVLDAVEAVSGLGGAGTQGFVAALDRAYAAAPSISIDYALMEKADNVVVLPARFQWNDVGHWLAMRDLWPADEQGNRSRDRVLALDSNNCIVHAPDRLTALIGVEDLVVVETANVTLVCAAERAQDIKRLLTRLEESGEDQYL